MTKTADLSEIEHNLTGILSLLSAGAEIIVTANNKPLARLVPIQQSASRIAGLHEGAMEMRDDFTDPLPDEFWMGNS